MSNIVVKNLTKVFDSAGGPLKILDDVSFEVAEGEFVCLLGPSGSGKSVTLNCISGLLEASQGSVAVDGVGVARKQPNYGYVFQQPRLLPWRTVEDNLRFALRAESGRAVPDEDKRIQDVLELVNLAGYEKFYPHQISGGMQHRVGIARAYVRDPGLLLMDEPFGALDEMTARRLRSELVATWMRDRRTVVFVTHDIIEACFLADRIVIYTPKPTRIADIIEVKLPRPREYGSEEMHEIESQVLAVFERTMTDFIQIIKDEHRAVAAVLTDLQSQVEEAARPGAQPDFVLLRAMYEYLVEFPEKIHHPKEDEYLFHALGARSPGARAVIAELEDEHRVGQTLIGKVGEALDRYERNPVAGERAGFANALQHYTDLQWRHMTKEEQILMPMAAQVLKRDDWERVTDAFKRNDNPLYGIKPKGDPALLRGKVLDILGRSPRQDPHSIKRPAA